MTWWAPVLAAGVSGGLNYLGASSAQKRQRAATRKAKGYYTNLQADQAVAGNQQLAELRKGQGFLQEGYSRARQSTRASFRSAERYAKDFQTSGTAQIEADLLASGRYNSSLLGLARMGVGYQTSRMLTEIGSRMSAALASIEAQRGRDLFQSQGAIAGQIGQNYDQRKQLADSLASIELGQTPVSQDYSREIGWLFAGIDELFGGKNTKDQSLGGQIQPNVSSQGSSAEKY